MSKQESSSTGITSKMSVKPSSMHCCRKPTTSGGKHLMSEHPPTLLIVYLCPSHNKDALSHLDEALTVAGIKYRLIAQQEERVSLESAAPFIFSHNENRMVIALRAPLDPKVIDDMAQLVATGLILGFAVKGEIALDDEIGVINNLVG